MGIVGTFFTAVGLVKGESARKDVKRARAEEASAQKRQQKAQRRIADVKAAAKRRKQLAETKKRQAQNVTIAQSKGALGSSVFAGVQASAQTQQASTVSDAVRIQEEIKQTNIFTDAASSRAQSLIDSASSSQGMANIFSGVGDITSGFDSGSTDTKKRVTEKDSIFNK